MEWRIKFDPKLKFMKVKMNIVPYVVRLYGVVKNYLLYFYWSKYILSPIFYISPTSFEINPKRNVYKIHIVKALINIYWFVIIQNFTI